MADRWELVFRWGTGGMTKDMWAAWICREMHWSYQEYLDTPIDFVANVRAMLREEALEQNRKTSKAR